MKHIPKLIITLSVTVLLPASLPAFFLPTQSAESKACAECHKKESRSIYEQWGSSKHYRANVGCFECHAAVEGDSDAFTHEGQLISVIVSPKDCARCRARRH